MVDDILLRASDTKAFGRLSAEKAFCLSAAAYLTYNCNHCNHCNPNDGGRQG